MTFMAPDPGLAPEGWEEIRAAVGALASAGIEVVLDVVLNHSGEGDALGADPSLRGLDNASYYRALPGTALALHRRYRLRQHVRARSAGTPSPGDGLHSAFWALQAGVHGFPF